MTGPGGRAPEFTGLNEGAHSSPCRTSGGGSDLGLPPANAQVLTCPLMRSCPLGLALRGDIQAAALVHGCGLYYPFHRGTEELERCSAHPAQLFGVNRTSVACAEAEDTHPYGDASQVAATASATVFCTDLL